jgi:ribosomal-protein-serine acetyltransferase
MVTFQLDDGSVLREFSESDVDAVYETVLANRQHLQTFMHWMRPEYSRQDATDFINQSIRNREERKGLGFGIFRKNRFLGSIGFVSFDWAARKTEIGYWISKDEEGKGIISNSTRLLIEFAFSELGLNRIEIRCSAENQRSSAVPKRFGFTKEGHLREAEFRNGKLHDFELYGLLAAEWKSIVSK